MLDKYQICNEAIEGCLTVLTRGKAKEIEKIFEILDKHGISKEAIKRCLTVLALGKAKKIEEVLKILNINNVSNYIIEKNFGYLLLRGIERIKVIFSPENQFVKKYMQLRGVYDKVVNEEEINNICEEKNITIGEVLEIIKRSRDKEIYREILKKKGGIYIGKGIPIQQDYLNRNGEMILELANRVARNFGWKYVIKDIDELKGQALEIIVGKCGGIVYNLEYHPEILNRSIYSYTYKCLKSNLVSKKELLVDFSEELEQRRHKSEEGIESDKDELNLESWDVSREQEIFLRYMSYYIEKGQEKEEVLKSVATVLNLSEEEVFEELEKIKEQNDKKRIREGEEYEIS